MTTRITTENGIIVVGESSGEIREKIKATSDGFIELTGIGGEADQELKKASNGIPVTINITTIIFYRDRQEEGEREHLNAPALDNRAHGNGDA